MSKGEIFVITFFIVIMLSIVALELTGHIKGPKR